MLTILLTIVLAGIVAAALFVFYQRVVKKEPLGIEILDIAADALFGPLGNEGHGAVRRPVIARTRPPATTASRSRLPKTQARTVRTARAATSAREAGTVTPPHFNGHAISPMTPTRKEGTDGGAAVTSAAVQTCITESTMVEEGTVKRDMSVFDALDAKTPATRSVTKAAVRIATQEDENETVTGAAPSVRNEAAATVR